MTLISICEKFLPKQLRGPYVNGLYLSDETLYEGGDLEFGITDDSGEKNYTAPRTSGSIIIFPSFLSHRVTPITKGRRYSLITWMNGDTWK